MLLLLLLLLPPRNWIQSRSDLETEETVEGVGGAEVTGDWMNLKGGGGDEQKDKG